MTPSLVKNRAAAGAVSGDHPEVLLIIERSPEGLPES